MIRLFNVYYPVRTLLLFSGEAVVVCLSFLLAALVRFREDSLLVLDYENGFYKIVAVTVLTLLCLYSVDLYDLQRLRSQGEIYLRVLVALGILSLLLGAVLFLVPRFAMGGNVFLGGLVIVTGALLGWRSAYLWLLKQPYFREHVYVLGSGERAARLVHALRSRAELGMEIVGWAGEAGSNVSTRESLGTIITTLKNKNAVNRVIVAMDDRRGKMPIRELLELRLNDVKVEEATGLIEQISGRIEVEDLNPSWLVFAEGFHMSPGLVLARRVISMALAFVCLLMVCPLLPLIALAIKLSSPGPILYKQNRVGRNGYVFNCYKFRTMCQKAEADSGPTWAADNDPRITRMGRILRRCRLDELPQLWNVLKGDMSFVGPRPERPEFVDWLTREIPYYHVRHTVRPGITGWAQINYPYGSSLEEAKEKLKYDLYHIKNMSVGFDFFIVFQTIKVVLFGRGAK